MSDERIDARIREGRTYVLGIITKGPNRSQPPEELEIIQRDHLRFLFDLKARGILLLQGPVVDQGTELNGICLFALDSKEEAAALMLEDPQVKAGRMTYEFYTFFGLPGDGLPYVDSRRLR